MLALGLTLGWAEDSSSVSITALNNVTVNDTLDRVSFEVLVDCTVRYVFLPSGTAVTDDDRAALYAGTFPGTVTSGSLGTFTLGGTDTLDDAVDVTGLTETVTYEFVLVTDVANSVVVSNSITINSTAATATYLDSDSTLTVVSGQTSINLSLDMSGYSGGDVLVKMGSFAQGAGNLSSATLDGQASTTIYNGDFDSSHFYAGYIVFPAASYSGTVTLALTYSDNTYSAGAAAYAIDAGATVAVLTNQTKTTRTGSTLGGTVGANSAVVATQCQRDGAVNPTGSWDDLTQNAHFDVTGQGNDLMSIASATGLSGAITVSPTGSNVETAGLSVEVSL